MKRLTDTLTLCGQLLLLCPSLLQTLHLNTLPTLNKIVLLLLLPCSFPLFLVGLSGILLAIQGNNESDHLKVIMPYFSLD